MVAFDVVNSPAHAFHYIKIGLSLHSLENISIIQYNKRGKARLCKHGDGSPV